MAWDEYFDSAAKGLRPTSDFEWFAVETLHHSRMDKVAAHPAYREIVAMGEKAVPLILADLEKDGGAWFMALREITGASPVPHEFVGS